MLRRGHRRLLSCQGGPPRFHIDVCGMYGHQYVYCQLRENVTLSKTVHESLTGGPLLCDKDINI